MADLTKMVEEWHGSSIRLYRILLTLATSIELSLNCIEDLRKEIEANREEIEKLKAERSK